MDCWLLHGAAYRNEGDCAAGVEAKGVPKLLQRDFGQAAQGPRLVVGEVGRWASPAILFTVTWPRRVRGRCGTRRRRCWLTMSHRDVSAAAACKVASGQPAARIARMSGTGGVAVGASNRVRTLDGTTTVDGSLC